MSGDEIELKDFNDLKEDRDEDYDEDAVDSAYPVAGAEAQTTFGETITTQAVVHQEANFDEESDLPYIPTFDELMRDDKPNLQTHLHLMIS